LGINGGHDARFDIVRLAKWRELFEYMQTKGVVPYLVLEDDSAWKDYDHMRYYREMIARFGDLPALLFNFDEEHNENYKLAEALEFMSKLEQIDPYDNSGCSSHYGPELPMRKAYKRGYG
jgi:hypothetical protein